MPTGIETDQVVDAVIVIVVFIAAVINRWEHRKTREEANGSGAITTSRDHH